MDRSRTASRVRAAGFTLLELMIVVAIIGILSAIAFPAYNSYLVKSKRAAAESHLMALAQAESQWMADSRSYTATVSDLGVPTPQAVSDKYTIAITTADAPPTFTITASPILNTDQFADGALSIDNAGTRTPSAKW